MKICSLCKETKSLDKFPFRDKKTGKLRDDCHACNNKRKNKWAIKNPEKVKEAQETFYENHRGKECLHCGLWYKPQGDIRFCSFKCNLLGNVKININSCWEWKGALTNSGYGKASINHKTINAHRASYEMFKEVIPKGLLVLHQCDNKKCINPDHLYIGDHKQNSKDAKDRGRRVKTFFRKYSWKIAKKCYDMKNKGMPYTEIAKKMKIISGSVRHMALKYEKYMNVKG